MKKLFPLLLCCLTLVYCGEAPVSDEAISMPAEQKLALLDAGTRVNKDDIKVIRMKTLLQRISDEYKEPVDSIADLTSRAQGVMHDNGIQETNLNILEALNKSPYIKGITYKDAVVLYAIERTQ